MLLGAGVWVFMSILVPLHWIKVGSDKLTLEKVFLRHFFSKGWDVVQYAYNHRELREKKTLFLYCKTTGLPKMCRFTSMIQNYVNHLTYGNTIFFYTEWEREQILVMAMMVLCDDNDTFMTLFVTLKVYSCACGLKTSHSLVYCNPL